MAVIHLLSNAHIDPVWQWEWEEGAAAAVSTFRAAADFCEEFDDYVFCHNEALLYRWVEEYEPALFERIRRLVKAGKWKIMGGWYLQPDCNMPSGESIIRQIQTGRAYFLEKFGVDNRTAISVDAFGHNRGLAQILKKAGYDSYLFCRPYSDAVDLPGESFIWVGYDGSEVMAHRLDSGYISALGHAVDKIRDWLGKNPNCELGLIAWGVGNHGGGPSRKDIADIDAFRAAHPEYGLVHSTPEAFFEDLSARRGTLPRWAQTLGPSMVGCYTSQIRIKQRHRELEALIGSTERMLTHAALAGLIEYPAGELNEAVRDLCMSEFHDILPGSSVQPVEETSLDTLSHGREVITRLRARAFFALAAGQAPAGEGEYPILVYNPHPYPVTADVACEFMMADQNWKDEFTDFTVWQGGVRLPAQIEKERSNLPLDWRKRVVFRATLPPMRISRFIARPNVLPKKPVPVCPEAGGAYVFVSGRMSAAISRESGLLTSYRVDGRELLRGPVKLLVLNDSEDPWGMRVDRFRDVIGEFTLMDERQSARFAGVKGETLPPVRVVEDGPVRTVIEAGFRYGDSCALIRYILGREDRSIGLEIRLQYMEKGRMVKLALPTVLTEGYVGQGMFGWGELYADGREAVAQQWTAARGGGRALTVINDGVYGSDCEGGEIRLSLIRSPAYTGHPIMERDILPQDRFSPRVDQGERLYAFVIEGGGEAERLENVSREALAFNEKPYALSFFPSGQGEAPAPGAILTGEGVLLTALRRSADGRGVIVRLFDSTGRGASAHVELPLIRAQADVTLSPFEFKTLRADPKTGEVTEASALD